MNMEAADGGKVKVLLPPVRMGNKYAFSDLLMRSVHLYRSSSASTGT